MNLITDLDARLIRLEPSSAGTMFRAVASLSDAQGVRFLCPKCQTANGLKPRSHMVICWAADRGVPDHVTPGPGRWCFAGTGLEDLSLIERPGSSRSIVLQGGCGWHGFVTQGQAA